MAKLIHTCPRAVIKAFIDAFSAWNPTVTIKPAGSYRRGKDKMKDVDLIIVEYQLADLKFKCPAEIVTNGDKHRIKRVEFRGYDFTVDLYFVEKRHLPFAMMRFTGNKDHNIGLSRIAMEKGWLLNQYGLFHRNPDGSAGNIVDPNIKSEKAIFEKLGHKYKPPSGRN